MLSTIDRLLSLIVERFFVIYVRFATSQIMSGLLFVTNSGLEREKRNYLNS